MKRFLICVLLIMAVTLFVIIAYYKDKETPHLTIESQAVRALVAVDLVVKQGFIYDIRAYGAIPNDGEDDTAYIQAALDSCYSQGGGTVYCSTGQWEIGFNSFLKVYSNTKIMGAGIGGTYFNYTKTSGSYVTGKPAFYVFADSNIIFSDFEIDGNAVNNGYMGEYDAGILLGTPTLRCKNIIIDRVYIHNTSGDGIEVRYTKDVTINNCFIDVDLVNLSTPQVGRNGISGLRVDGLKITNCTLSGSSLPANIDIEPTTSEIAANVIITGNKISEGFYGISTNGSIATACDSIIISNNIIFNTDSSSMVHWATSNLIISNNIIGNADGYGIEIRPNQSGAQNIINNEIYGCKLHGLLVGQTNSNVKVAGNRCYENGMSGIRIAGDSGIDRNVFFEITGNSCWNNGNIVGGDSSGIFLSYTDSSLFSNNFCYDNQSSPTQAFGFQLSNCTATNLGFNNIGYGNSSGLFSLSGLIIPSGTGEIFTMSGQLLFNKVTPSNDELVNFYDTNFASVVIQSGGGSRWWIAADTSSLYNNKLLIGGAGNTTPIITDYPIVCNDAGGTTLTDSVQINKDGVWIRKMFWSITGDSLGIIGFNTVDGEIDTAWAVTK